MDVSYQKSRVEPTEEEHADAKEVNDLINALVDNLPGKAKEAFDVVMTLADDVADPASRFIHFYKVFTAVLDNQLQARFLEPTIGGP